MIGTTLRQRYQITQRLGAGGFGETYLAEDLGIPVTPKPKRVVKHLKPQQQHPAIKRLFEQEGAILYKLGQHDQIPQLFEYFEDNGQFFLIQEYIEGQDLEGEIQQSQQIWTEAQVIQFLQEMLEILSFVHRHNIIHRDIKPANIMRRQQDGKLVLIDFGIVKELSTTRINSQGQTTTSIAIGTSGYMASEQAYGRPRLSSDIYALGQTAIELLTGVNPYFLPDDNQGEVVWQDKAKVSDKLANFLTTMVRYHFKERYVNATEALQIFTNIFSLSTTSASSQSIPFSSQHQSYKVIPITVKKESFTFVEVNSRGRIIDRYPSITKIFQEDFGQKITLDMVYIPGGTFMMGAPESEHESSDSQRPQHRVKVQPFWMGKYVITQEQWRRIAALPKLEIELDSDPSGYGSSYLKGNNRPVDSINWYDAIEFCARLSKTTGRKYCLPSEAQWEYACRAGTTTPFSCGATITNKLTNYDCYSEYGTVPVGSFPPNAFGLYEMHGNIKEWCADPWHKNYIGAPNDERVWKKILDDDCYKDYCKYIKELLSVKEPRVVRGGSYSSYPRNCRSASRSYYSSEDKNWHCGFRVICLIPSQTGL